MYNTIKPCIKSIYCLQYYLKGGKYSLDIKFYYVRN